MVTARKRSECPSPYGRLVDDEPLPSPPLGSIVRAVKWEHDRRRNKEIPSGCPLRLLIVEDDQGLRRVFPRGGDQDFLIQASAGGRGILFRQLTPKPGDRQTYRLMHLLFQRSFNDRRMMARKFSQLDDVSLSWTERAGESVRDILPEIYLPGAQRPLTPAKLYRIGAKANPIRVRGKLNTAQVIEAALIDVARAQLAATNGYEPGSTAVAIQFALFGMEAGEVPADEITELIEGRLWDAIWKHRDCPLGEFERFLLKDVDNLVQQLAKRKPAVTRAEVHQVLNDLLWRSFLFVSQCVAMQMQAVRQAIDPPLNAEERRLFGHRYELQPDLGGLAPVALSSRLGFTWLTWDQLSSSPPDEERLAWSVLIQALLWDSEMVINRRRADVLQKSQQEKCFVAGRRSRSTTFRSRSKSKKKKLAE